MGDSILRLENVKVSFPLPGGAVFHAVDGVSLELAEGETLGIVGESGSGKTMLALSMMGLVPKPGQVSGGGIHFADEDIGEMTEMQLCGIRGDRIGMIFQDPLTSLNPVRRIGSVLVEAIRRHGRVPKYVARRRALEALKEVGIPSPEARMDAYPHELSGGLRQRITIALALINHPSIIIADEPTTALDTTIQAQILTLLRERRDNAAIVLITHDLGVAAELCDRIAVMYRGRIAEIGTVAQILEHPCHPYSAGLLAAVPRFDFERPKLLPIPGSPPGSGETLTGCAFRPRCARAAGECEFTPELRPHDGRMVACFWPLTDS
jgi:oligopeptide/dipeptide ABC transporter ATP-binding protein